MIEIMVIEIISIVSYIYSLLMMFVHIAAIKETILIFIWTIIVSLIFALNYKKSKIYELIMILLFVPLIFYNDKMSIFFIIVTSIISYLYIKTSLLQGSYHSYSNKIKKSYLLYLAAAYLRLALIETPGSVFYAFPFVIIYVLTSIVLLRSIRHLDSGLESEKIKKTNRIYLVSMAVVFAIGTIEGLRVFLKSVFDNITGVIVKIIYFPVQILSFLIQKFMDSLGDDKKMLEALDNILVPGEREPVNPEELGELAEKVARTNNQVFKAIGIFVFTLILIYIIYKILAKTGNKSYEGLEYTEEREYIKKDETKKRFWFRERYPSGFSEQIRYYYRKYLNKLDKEGVEVLKSDTSARVNERAEERFPEEIEEIREIYIKSRYGEKIVEEKTVERMKNLYKRL